MILHFGGSRPGINNHLNDYRTIRSQIIGLGHQIARDWLEKQKQDLVNMFTENERSISKSDGVILDATFDSHSIGIQLALALMYKRPVLLLIKKGAVAPITNPKIVNARDKKLLQTIEYKNARDIELIIERFVSWIQENSQLARFNIELDRKLDNYLKLKANVNHTSKAEEIRRLVEEDLDRSWGTDKD